MSTDTVAVQYDDDEMGGPASGTLRFLNTSGMASWTPSEGARDEGKAMYFSKRELVALAKAVLRHEHPGGPTVYTQSTRRYPVLRAALWLLRLVYRHKDRDFALALRRGANAWDTREPDPDHGF